MDDVQPHRQGGCVIGRLPVSATAERKAQGETAHGQRAVRFVHTLKAPENGFLCQNSRFERRKPVPWGRSRHGWRDALREMASRGIGCGLVLGSKLRYRRLQAALI
jgi:hypothetical protein